MEAFLLFLNHSFLHEKPILLAFCQPESFINKYIQIPRAVKMEIHKDVLKTVTLNAFVNH